MRLFSFKNFRILVLLIILASVANYVKDQKLVTQGWYKSLDIVVYPINPSNSPSVDRYIDALSLRSFSRIDNMVKRESKKYNIVSQVIGCVELCKEKEVTLPEFNLLGRGQKIIKFK